jgi:hypothetical protein
MWTWLTLCYAVSECTPLVYFFHTTITQSHTAIVNSTTHPMHTFLSSHGSWFTGPVSLDDYDGATLQR